MQTYEVTGKYITFGIGTELKLIESQAESRATSLKNKRKDIFEVVEPVQFKQGEKITISPESLTKSLLENLKEISDKKPDGNSNKIEVPTEYPCIQHVSFGKYNVFDAEKNLLTPKPIKKDEAEKILAELIKKNETDDNTNEDEENQEKKQSDNGANGSDNAS
jgi:predicted DNA-binding antitoxin AbrB/MazE fold protein